MKLGLHRAEPSSVQGYTTRRHLLLDLDHRSYTQVAGLACIISQSWPELGGCIIVLSSKPRLPGDKWLHYRQGIFAFRKKPRWHIVFDNAVGYDKCCEIIETLVHLDVLDRRYGEIRTFRGDMTLRISRRVESWGVIPKPQIIYYNSGIKLDDSYSGIAEYIKMWKAVNPGWLTRFRLKSSALYFHILPRKL